MNITEANHVARLLHLLDGTYAGTNVDQVVESVATLAERAAKPLQLQIKPRLDDVADTVTHLIQRQADREVEINLGTDHTESEPTS